MDGGPAARRAELSEALSGEIRSMLEGTAFREALRGLLKIDPAFVRRKFYERAAACGFDKQLGGPEMIRRARAVEPMQDNMPLPAVQALLACRDRVLVTGLGIAVAEEPDLAFLDRTKGCLESFGHGTGSVLQQTNLIQVPLQGLNRQDRHYRQGSQEEHRYQNHVR